MAKKTEGKSKPRAADTSRRYATLALAPHSRSASAGLLLRCAVRARPRAVRHDPAREDHRLPGRHGLLGSNACVRHGGCPSPVSAGVSNDPSSQMQRARPPDTLPRARPAPALGDSARDCRTCVNGASCDGQRPSAASAPPGRSFRGYTQRWPATARRYHSRHSPKRPSEHRLGHRHSPARPSRCRHSPARRERLRRPREVPPLLSPDEHATRGAEHAARAMPCQARAQPVQNDEVCLCPRASANQQPMIGSVLSGCNPATFRGTPPLQSAIAPASRAH